MALSFAEFKAALQADEAALAARQTVTGILACVACEEPLQESVTGSRHTHKGYMCSDCYFEELGRELDAHPIMTPRAVR
ncbi:hypothetical protein [Phenylobacterium sp.]|jgi:hypothetical protein|uniref:hypothetical protein n=1 Tax=Phenylobacterium sp. TaxID=1871053 RepID=UPI0035AFB6D1